MVIETDCLVIIVNITVEIVFWVLIKEQIMKAVIVFVNINYPIFYRRYNFPSHDVSRLNHLA